MNRRNTLCWSGWLPAAALLCVVAPACWAQEAKSEAAKSAAAESETAKSETAKSETAKSETAKSETAKSETAKSETAKSETAKSETAKSETAKSATAKSEAVEETGEPATAAAADHDEHDKYDLSHSNALPSQESPAEWKFDMAIYSAVVFVLLLIVLGKFAWGPINEGLTQRERRIASLIDDAEQSTKKANQRLADYEKKLAAAQEAADGILSRAEQSAKETSDRMIDEAKDAAQREKERAVAEIELAKNEALSEVTQKSVDIALNLASSIVHRELSSADHDSLIQEALGKFPQHG